MTLHDAALTVSAQAIYLSGFRIVTSLVQERPVWIGRVRFPWVAVALLAVTLTVNVWQLADQSLVGSLGRNPGDLGSGRLWKLLTPLLIQSDGVAQLVSNTASFVLVVPLAELVLGSGPVLALYLLGGMAGQAAGFAWAPQGGGNSVAVAGVLGGLYALMLLDRRASRPVRLLAGVGIAGGPVLAAVSDNHGVAILTGLVVGAVLMAVHWMPRVRPVQRAWPGD